MKYAVLTHANPRVSKGGGELASLALYEGLRDLGEDVVLISMVPPEQLSSVWPSGRSEPVLTYDHATYDDFYHVADGVTQEEIVQTIKSLNVDFVFAHHFLFIGTNTLMRLKDEGIGVALTLHEFLAICQNHGQFVTSDEKQLCYESSAAKCTGCFSNKFASQFAARGRHFQELLNNLDTIISPSEFLADRFDEWGFPKTQINIVENGLMLKPSPEPEAPDLEDRSVVFGFFGQINPFKGADVLIEAAEQLAKQGIEPSQMRIRVHGKFVGLPPDTHERYLTAMDENPLLEFTGAYEHRDVIRLMQGCDYVVIPSLWWENSPLVIQEAFLAGRPLIVSGIGGMAEKVRPGKDGLHFQVGRADDLARQMIRGCDAELYQSFVSQLSQSITAKEMAEKYLELI